MMKDISRDVNEMITFIKEGGEEKNEFDGLEERLEALLSNHFRKPHENSRQGSCPGSIGHEEEIQRSKTEVSQEIEEAARFLRQRREEAEGQELLATDAQVQEDWTLVGPRGKRADQNKQSHVFSQRTRSCHANAEDCGRAQGKRGQVSGPLLSHSQRQVFSRKMGMGTTHVAERNEMSGHAREVRKGWFAGITASQACGRNKKPGKRSRGRRRRRHRCLR